MSRWEGVTALQRFEEKIIRTPSGCWRWMAWRDRDGYGSFSYLGRGWYAHRVAMILYRGIDPGKLQVDHLCRHPWCVNPLHLDLVTSKVNTLRGTAMSARHSRKTKCNKGHALTPENVYSPPYYPTSRACRICRAERQAQRAQRRREARSHQRTADMDASKAECTSRWFAGLTVDHLFEDCPARRIAEPQLRATGWWFEGDSPIDPHQAEVCGICLHRHNQREHRRAA